MKKYEKEVQQAFLNNEEAVIKELKKTYDQSLVTISAKVKKLDLNIAYIQKALSEIEDDDIGDLAKILLGKKKHLTPEEAKETLKSMLQSKVYQKNYQTALKNQVSGILDKMHQKEFKTVSDYLVECYDNGFMGAMYSLQNQGIPMCFPIDQTAMVRAIQLDSKIKKSFYESLGENVADLKKTIVAEVSRGISTGMSYSQVAQQIKARMVGNYDDKPGGALYRAMTIARTEGHRVQVQSAMNASYSAKEKGADVVKQWDAALDSSTRESHAKVDGEIRELDKPFSNGLMFPGDPSGGAAEVINCRCALLQRARWALDEDELETLKERAKYFGLDKTENFEEYKQKYLKAAGEQTKPKKEYLTEKKLKQNIDDANAQMSDLHDQFMKASGHIEYDDIINDFGSLEDFAKGDQLAKLKSIKKQMDDLDKQTKEWSEKLNKKLTSKEMKKLKKEEILLKDELNGIDVKTYSGIWKDDVTTADWKNLNIEGKKKYYEGKFITENDPVKVKMYQDYYNQLKELDEEGKKYYEIQQKLSKVQADLTNLQKNGIISPKNTDLDAFTQDRKDKAYWFTTKNGGTAAADKVLRDKSGEVWRNATSQERNAIYDYTCGSGKFNRPLSGFQKPYSEYGSGWEPKYYKGVKNVWIDYEGAGDEIRRTTDIISRSTYDFDMWLQRGCNGNAMESFLGLAPDTFARMSDAQLQQFVGRSNRIYSFVSTSVSKGKGFGGQCIMNIYAPKGTQMMYAEPFSHFGSGSKLKWNGVSPQNSFGYEAEMLVQRGASYTITKIEKANGQIYIDLEIHNELGYDLFQQDPSEWKGSTAKGR